MGRMKMTNRARGPRRSVAVALVTGLVAGLLALGSAPAHAITCAAPPTGDWLGTWNIDNYAGGGTVRANLAFVNGTSLTGSLIFSTGQTVLAPGSLITGSWSPASCSYTLVSGPVTGSGLITPNGVEMIGTWKYLTLTGTVRTGYVNDSAAGDGVATTDDESDGVSLADPVETTVVSPNPGPITIDEATSTGGTLPGYAIVDNLVKITAPSGTPSAPLLLIFDVDSSSLGGVPITSLTVFRNGLPVPLCLGTVPPIVTDPCVTSREPLAPPQSGARFAVFTSEASVWAFGAPAGTLGLRVATAGLPAATLGQPYSATLAAAGTSFTVKWKKVGKLPKGLKLDPRTGVISGTPKKTTGVVTFGVQIKEIVKKALRHTAMKQLSITVS